MRTELPTGTVTFLFTDVEGSTRLLHSLGAEGYAEALAEHRRVIREACAADGGVEVDTQGDAFFFAFPTAPGAVAAASAFTEDLAAGLIQVRVGLHTGAPLVTEEGYVGDDVHFAARVAASAHGGQVICSAATAELVEHPLTDLGEHRLKDVAEAVAIFQVGNGSFPPLKTISNTNLPRPASSFVGREAEVEAVRSRIEGGARLVTLTGPGGSGKTRLAIEAASTLVPEYKAGVFWVGLAALRDPALVTETIAQTLGAKDGLAEHIGERELLLLLDNLEQVIEVAPELASLLERCPNLTMLVTSRELLRVRGEVEYAVPPLAEPEAVSLFCERAQLEPSDEIAELCARLDSLPLAVELAAARTKALSPTQILERLSQRLDLLRGGRDADPRQQTLRTTIEWSYDLLSDDERQLLASLAVFAGGCTLEAAEQVCDADLETLQSLVEKSLLRFTEGRYWMLETIREYADERLGASGSTSTFRERHAAWCVGLTSDRPPDSLEDRLEAFALFRDEHDNLRACLSWLLETGDTDAASGLIWSLFTFWRAHGFAHEGYSWARQVFPTPDAITRRHIWGGLGAGELARYVDDLDVATAYKTKSIGILSSMGEERWVAAVTTDLSDIASLQGDLPRALALSDAALKIRLRVGEPRGIAHALDGRGIVEFRAGLFPEAIASFEQAQAQSPRSPADGLLMIGESARRMGDVVRARDALRASISVVAADDPSVIPEILQEVGALALVGGRLDTATRLLAASYTLQVESGLPFWDRDDYESNLSRVREELGEEAFAAEWRVGAIMSAGDALRLAVAALD